MFCLFKLCFIIIHVISFLYFTTEQRVFPHTKYYDRAQIYTDLLRDSYYGEWISFECHEVVQHNYLLDFRLHRDAVFMYINIQSPVRDGIIWTCGTPGYYRYCCEGVHYIPQNFEARYYFLREPGMYRFEANGNNIDTDTSILLLDIEITIGMIKYFLPLLADVLTCNEIANEPLKSSYEINGQFVRDSS
ncbi:unnamed protein product [Trichobilharzia regenti]|nr:unnamed protein product [Trichobilharzia regenti]